MIEGWIISRFSADGEREEPIGSVGRVCNWGSNEGLLVRDSPPSESLCCALEQDTISTVKYWFSPGDRNSSDMTRNVDWDVKHQNKQTKDLGQVPLQSSQFLTECG